MVSLRALMYFGMILVAITGWFMQRRHQNRPQNQNDVTDIDLDNITDALHHVHWRIRVAAVEKLQTNHDSKTLKTLLKMLNDDVSDVREVALKAVVAYGDQAITGLGSILKIGKLEAREGAIQALRAIGTPATIPVLVKALQDDESAWVRMPAAESLGVIGGDEACKGLISALNDPHSDVRDAVQKALQQIGTATALSALEGKEQLITGRNRRKGKNNLIYFDEE